jgi:predicted DNA-binding transcriptional regulator YafY
MLQLIPRAPARIEAKDLVEGPIRLGYDTNYRTTLRDLEVGEVCFPLRRNGHKKPYTWSWDRDAGFIDVPGISAAAASVYVLVEQNLLPLLPPAMRAALAPNLAKAHRVLAELAGKSGADFASRVRVIPVGPALQTPPVSAEVVDAVTEAVHRTRLIEARYKSRDAPAARDYVLHPLGLAMRGVKLALAARVEGRDFVQQFVLHRFESARMLDARADRRDFDLDAWIRAGELAVKLSPDPIDLVMRFSPDLAPEVQEIPLVGTTGVETEPDGWLRVHATVPDTFALRTWLLGFERRVEVVEPPPLRAWMGEVAWAMAARYHAAEPAGPGPARILRKICGDSPASAGDDWVAPSWDARRLLPRLAEARHRQGRLAGRLAGLSPEQRAEVELAATVDEALAASALAGEALDPDAVRAWAARELEGRRGGRPPEDPRVDPAVRRVVEAARDARPLDVQMPEAFRRWLAAEEADPIVRAGLAHLALDGGPARAVADRALFRGEAHRFFGLSAVIAADRAGYDAARASARDGDATAWLAWFVEAVIRALDAAEARARAVLRHAAFWQAHAAGPAFSERQRVVLARLLDDAAERVTASIWSTLAGCSLDTAQRDLADLVARGVLARNPGAGRNTSYRFAT